MRTYQSKEKVLTEKRLAHFRERVPRIRSGCFSINNYWLIDMFQQNMTNQTEFKFIKNRVSQYSRGPCDY